MSAEPNLEVMGHKLAFFLKNWGPILAGQFTRVLDELGDRAQRVVFVGSGVGTFESKLAQIAETRGLDIFAVDPDPMSFASEDEEILLPPTHNTVDELPQWEHGTILVMLWPTFAIESQAGESGHTWDVEALDFPHEALLVFFGPCGSSGSPQLVQALADLSSYHVPLYSSHTLKVGTGLGMEGLTLVLQVHLAGFEGKATEPEPKYADLPNGDLIKMAHNILSTCKQLDNEQAYLTAVLMILPALRKAGLVSADM